MRLPPSVVSGFALLAFAQVLPALAVAQSYVANYVYIGAFRAQGGDIKVYLDVNQPDGLAQGHANAAVKILLPSQAFYRSMIQPKDVLEHVEDKDAAYASLSMGVDCASRTVREGHAVFYNAKDQWVADHTYDWNDAKPVEPNSLGEVVTKRICGR